MGYGCWDGTWSSARAAVPLTDELSPIISPTSVCSEDTPVTSIGLQCYAGNFCRTAVLYVEVNLFLLSLSRILFSPKRCQFSEAGSRVERKGSEGAGRVVREAGRAATEDKSQQQVGPLCV